jgi:hypothetical protein
MRRRRIGLKGRRDNSCFLRIFRRLRESKGYLGAFCVLAVDKAGSDGRILLSIRTIGRKRKRTVT